MDEKILEVPYISQNDPFIDEEWYLKNCGIVCLAMTLEFYKKPAKIMDLINEGVLIGGYGENAWSHDSLVRIFRNHGIHAYAEEFRSIEVDVKNKNFNENVIQKKFIQNGINKIYKEIEKENPVMVSVLPGFGENKSPHLILVVGYKKESEKVTGFYVHDPDFRSQKGTKNRFISTEDLINFWRKFAIFSYQN